MLPEDEIRQTPGGWREPAEEELATSIENVRALRERYGWDHLTPEDWEAIRKHINSSHRRRKCLDRATLQLMKAKDEDELRECHLKIYRLIEKTRSGTQDAFPADVLLRHTGAKDGLLFVKGREEEALQYLEQQYGFKRPTEPRNVSRRARELVRRLRQRGELLPSNLFDPWLGMANSKSRPE